MQSAQGGQKSASEGVGRGGGREQGLAQLTGHVQRCLAQTVCKHKTQLNPLQPLLLLLLEQKLSLAALCVCPSVLGLYKIKTSGSAALNYMKRKLLTFLAAGREGGRGEGYRGPSESLSGLAIVIGGLPRVAS